MKSHQARSVLEINNMYQEHISSMNRYVFYNLISFNYKTSAYTASNQ